MTQKQEFHKGDKVQWSSGQGTATGTIEEFVTEDKTVDGNEVSASKESPRYLVKNDNTGNVTGHSVDALSRVEGDSNGSGSNGSGSNGSDEFSEGDRVAWNTAQGKTTGTVQKKLTETTDIKGHTAKASQNDPQYLVESESTGKEAAHKPDALESA